MHAADSEGLLMRGIEQDVDLPQKLLEMRNRTIEKKLAEFSDSLDRGSRLTDACEKFYRAAGGISTHWPNVEEAKLRDFLEGGKHTVDDVAAFMRENKLNVDTFVWEWQDDDGQWKPYSEHEQKQLRQNYFRRPAPERWFDLARAQSSRGSRGVAPRRPAVYSIDFVKMQQQHTRTRKTRAIRGKGLRGRILPSLQGIEAGVQRLSHDGSVADRTILDSLQRCLMTSPDQLGQGRDVAYAKGWEHVQVGQRKMCLQSAWKLHNPKTEQKYQAGMTGVAQDFRDPTLTGTPVAQVDPDLTERTAGLWQYEEGDQRTELGETFLYHGVPPDAVLPIIQNGLSEKFAGSNAGSMFGEGIYLAEDSGKCDQYCTPDCGKNDELHRMLYADSEDFIGPVYYLVVCKVILGKTAEAWSSRPPVTDSRGRPLLLANKRDLVTVPGSKKVHYHSLLADQIAPGSKLRYKEFVSFHSERIRPVYLLAYTRDSTVPARKKKKKKPTDFGAL
jgi:hypothetical protein